MNYLDVASEMYGGPLPDRLKNRLTSINSKAEKYEGVLRSRQLIAMIVQQFEDEEKNTIPAVAIDCRTDYLDRASFGHL